MRLFTVVLILILFSKENEDELNNCYVKDPVNELEWLNQLIFSYTISSVIKTPSIFEYTYRESVFFTTEKNNKIRIVYNCEGKVVYSYKCSDESVLLDFNNKAIRKRKLWPE